MQLNLNNHTALEEAITILRHYEPPEGYYLAFSGGKDSVVLHRVAEMAGVKFDAHYAVTTIDPPEVIHFMRNHYPNLIWDRPEHSFYWYVERKGLPWRTGRWCCQLLKETGGDGRVVLTGIRAAESSRRARRPFIDKCQQHPSRLLIHPIRDWSDDEVWEFIHKEHLPYCELYDQGWKRIGCVVCPFERKVKRSQERWPGIWAATKRAVGRGWVNYPDTFATARREWKTPQGLWDWWCRRYGAYHQEEKQPGLFSL